MLCSTETVISTIFIHLLYYDVALKIFLIANVFIFLNEIVKLLDVAQGQIRQDREGKDLQGTSWD